MKIADKVLELYRNNPGKYFSDDEAAIAIDNTRRAVCNARHRLLKHGWNLNMKTTVSNTLVCGFTVGTQKLIGPGRITCRDMMKDPDDSLDWNDMLTRCLSNDTHAFIEAIRKFNHIGYWSNEEISELSGLTVEKVRQMVNSAPKSGSFTFHGIDNAMNRRYRLISYDKSVVRYGRLIKPRPKPVVSHAALMSSVFS